MTQIDPGTSGRLVPLWATCAVGSLISLLIVGSQYLPSLEIFNRLEWITYDWRVRHAAHQESANQDANHLGFVFISDDSIEALLDGSLDYRAGLYWPRHVYGRLTRELAHQNARAVGFDILLPNLRPDHPPTFLPDGTNRISSDLFFARELQAAGNVLLAADKGVLPAPLFRTNAIALGDISAEPDSDGILRRATAFQTTYIWHRLIQQAARIQGFDLRRPSFAPSLLAFPVANGSTFPIPLTEGKFDQVALYESLSGRKAPKGFPQRASPAQELRIWDLGITLAAAALKLDLTNPRIEKNEIILTGMNGTQRTIPVDDENRFYVDWSIKPTDENLTKESIESLLDQERRRRLGEDGLTNRWENKLVVVGSIASGNDLTDLGATPLEHETYLTSRLWNVANSVLMDRFIREPSPTKKIAFCFLACGIISVLTYRLRTIYSTVLSAVIAAAYVATALFLFLQYRTWIPLIPPLAGGALTHFGLLTYKATFEQKERRRIKAVFAKIVSPNVVNELLSSEKLLLGGARRNITVFFADIRGFTELTDQHQARVEEFALTHNLDPEAAARHFHEQAQIILETVNLYLSLIADIVKKNDGTLDKYIGDCVMAFWGAPNAHEHHAITAVRSAIEAQRAISALNQQRHQENERIKKDNESRAAQGLPLVPLLDCLALGIGINTGSVTVGLMGSHDHIVNYTVFGREVNLASRLEAFSDRERIIIGETTYREIAAQNPDLSADCIQLEPTKVKGFRDAVNTYEVQWKTVALPHGNDHHPRSKSAA